jgi:transposase
MAFSRDYRRRAVDYKDEGHTFKELQAVFKIPRQTYYIWKERFEIGYYDTEHKFERSRKIDKGQLKAAVKEKPGAYLWELAQLFNCSEQAVFYMLEKLGITVKKRPLLIVSDRKKNERNMPRS